LPNLSRCTATGASDERASDPWLSFGPDGTLYYASLTFSETPINPIVAGPTKLVVSTSQDGGRTWNDPVDVQPFDGTYNDREAITADPTRPGHAYYAFVKRYGAFGESGIEMFSRTTDGGKTWSTPAPILIPPPGTLTDPTLILVLPDGTLVNVALVANLSPFLPDAVPRVPWVVVAARSQDQGQTWSLPGTIATLTPGAPVDPDSGKIVRGYNLISAAVSPQGTAYVAWNEIESASSSRILLASSTDGATWSAPIVVRAVASQAFVPSLAVSGEGTIGVAYYDFRNDRAGDDTLTTDLWFSHSRDGGATWKESHLAGPFDILTAPETESSGVAGLFVGDYESLAGLPGSAFVGVFTVSRPLAQAGPSDIVFARIEARD
jgi:Neuraminidase (sialidase)